MKTRLLILGANGMLGNTLLRYFSVKKEFKLFATVRNNVSLTNVEVKEKLRLITGIEAENLNDLKRVFDEAKPDIVMNCVGIVKQLEVAKEALVSIASHLDCWQSF